MSIQKKCDIIIPVWNQLEFTKRCIESIRKNTRFPYRLIIIDNNSEPPTKNYLSGIADRHDDVLLIRNEDGTLNLL